MRACTPGATWCTSKWGQGLVGLSQRVGVGHGLHGYAGRQRHELLGVAPGGVGHAADLPLPPQQAVGELGDAVQVNGVHRHYAAPVQGPQCRHHHLTHRCEGDGSIQRHRGRVVVASRPLRPQVQGAALLGRRPGGDEDLASPVGGHLDGEQGRGAEPVEAEALAGADARDAQRPVPDDAAAEKGGGRPVGEMLGEAHRHLGPGNHLLGVAAVAVPPGEAGLLTEVLPPAPAEGAGAAGPGGPAHPGPVAHLPTLDLRAHGDDSPHYLVPGNDGEAAGFQVALDQLQVGAADPAGRDPKGYLAGSRDRVGEFCRLQRRAVDGPRAAEKHGPHGRTLPCRNP
jgi:hypothetical protein